MSDLRGEGWGDKHDWKKGETKQSKIPQDRYTKWTCNNCQRSFPHFYHWESDIFFAIRVYGIPEECIEMENKK